MIALYIILGLFALFILVTALPVSYTFTRHNGKNSWRLWFLFCSVGPDGLRIFGIKMPDKSQKKKDSEKKDEKEQEKAEHSDDQKEASIDKDEKKSKKDKRPDEKEKDSGDFGWREFRILLDEQEYVIKVLRVVLRFVVRLVKAFKLDLSEFMLHIGCPDPACVGMAQGWLYSVGVNHRAYYFDWKLDGEGRLRIRVIPLYILFIILRLIIEVKPFRLYKLYRKTKGGKDGERNSGNPEDTAGRDQGHRQDRDNTR